MNSRLPLNPHQLIQAFSAYLTSRALSPTSIKLYTLDLRKFLSWLDLPLDFDLHSLSSTSFQTYLNHLRHNLTDQATLSRTTSSLRRFVSFLNSTHQLTLTPPSISASTDSSDFSKYLTRFLNYLKAEHLSDLSIKSYKSDVTLYLEWGARHLPSTQIDTLLTKKSTQKYLEYLSKVQNHPNSTTLRKAQSLKRLTEWYATTQKSSLLPDNKFSNVIREKKNFRSFYFSRYLSLLPFLVLSLLTTLMAVFAYRQLARDRVILTQAYPSTPVTPNRQISFQGRLENAGGTPITTATNFVFKLWNDPSAGTQLYTTGTCSITPDSDGVFSSQIGSTCGSAIDSTVFTENANVYLEVTVGAETLSPRQQIATVAYALNAETIQGIPISATMSAVANTVVPMNQWGEIIIGEQSPRMRAVSGTYNISAPALSLTTNTGTSGNITLAPDGTGQVNVQGNTTTTNFFNVSNAQLSTGSLITGTVGNNNTGFKLLNLLSGSSPTSKFSVDYAGNTTLASGADLTIGTIGLNDIGSSNTTSGASLIGTYDEFDNSTSTTVQDVLDDLDNAIANGGAGAIWTDSGTTTYLTDTTDELVLGGSSPLSSAKFSIDGDADQIQAVIQANATQTANLMEWQNSGGTPLLRVNNNGYFLGDATTGVDTALTVSGGAADNASGPAIDFNHYYGAGTYPSWQLGQIYATHPAISGWAGELVFKTNDTSSATALVERMRIKYDGTIQFPTGTTMTGLGSLQLSKTSGTLSTTFGDGFHLGVGSTEYGANTYRNIGFGYVATTAYSYPAIVGYQETNSTGQTYGDLVFGTRNVTTNTPASERMRITSAGDVYISDGLSLYETAVSDGTIEATKFCTGDGETNCVTDFSALSGGASIWTDGGTYIYPTAGETLGNSTSAGSNKLAGLYLADSSPLVFGTDNDITYTFDNASSTLNVTQDNADVNFDSNTLFVDGSANRVGVGTNNPTYTLDVAGNLRTANGYLTAFSSSGVPYVSSTTGLDLRLTSQGYTTDSNGLTVDITGNVGVGTTSPTTKLDVDGTASSSGTLAFRGTTDPKIDILNGENFGIRTSVGGDTGLTERLTVLNNGRVGIGTNNPSGPLHTSYAGNSTNYFDGDLTAAWSESKLYLRGRYGSTNTQLEIWSGGSNPIIRQTGSNAFQFGQNGGFYFQNYALSSTFMYVGSSVGIGTTGPDRKLDILDASNPQLRLTQADGTVYSDFQTNGSGYLTISPSGNITTLTGDTYLTSGLSTFSTAVSDGTIEATKFCTGDGETNCVTDFAAISGGATIWTDAGTYIYPTSGEVLGNSTSAGSNKLAGIYLADSSPLVFGTDNDVAYSFSGTELAITQGSNDINFDANTLFVDGSANRVGIANNTPAYPLDVSGRARIYSETAGAQGYLYFGNGGAYLRGFAGYWYLTNGAGAEELTIDLNASSATTFSISSGDFVFDNNASNEDISFKVNDGGVDTNVLTLHGATSTAGLGTTAPDAMLEINHATGDVLRLTYNDSDGSATAYTDFSLASDGDLTIDSAGGNITLASGDILTVTAADIYAGSGISTFSTAVSDGTVEATKFCTGDGETNCVTDFSALSGGATIWTDSSTTTYLTTTTDELVLGGSSPLSSAKFSIDGDADQIQAVIQANATQTANLTEWQNSSGTVLAGVQGRGTFYSNLGTDATNFFIGASSGNTAATGTNNVAVGSSSLDALTSGNYNMALGSGALGAVADGSSNVGIGWLAGTTSVSGNSNLAIGSQALRYNETGNSNVAIGTSALIGAASRNPSESVAIGASAGAYGAGAFNTYVGSAAGYGNSSGSNAFVGYQSGYSASSSQNTTLLGYRAGFNLSTGDDNIFIGKESGYRQTTASNLLIVDNQARADVATEATNAILYGVMAATPASQTLSLNALTTVSQDLYLSSGLSTFGTAVSDGTVEATKFCTGDGETNCVTDFSSFSSTPKWNSLSNPDGALALTMAAYTSTFGSTASGTGNLSPWAFNLTNSSSNGTQNLLSLTNVNGSTGTTESLLYLDNADDTALTNGIQILGSSTGAVTTAIDVSDAEIVTALSVGANDIVGTTGLINYTNFDVDASGNVTTAGTLTLPNSNTMTGVASYTQLSAGLSVGGATTYYLDSSGNLNANTGTFAGTLTANGNIVLGNAITDTIDFQGRVLQDADLIPITTTGTNDLGSSSLPWDNLYVNSLNISSLTLADNTANAFQLKEGSNVYLDITTTDNAESFSLNLPVGGVTSHTANLFTANIAQTINLGTGTAVDTINIGTGGTGADDINIGGTATSHTDFTGIVNLAGGTTYKIDASGNATFNDLVALDTGNPGLTVGNGTTGYFKIGGSTISDAAGNLTLDSDSNAITIAATDTTLTATALATLDMAASVAWDATTLTLGGSATLYGGSAASGTLTLASTSNATKGNIQFFDSTNTLSSTGNLTIAGDLRVNGNDIADSGGTNRITLGATTTLTNTTTTLSGTTTLTASSLATFTTASALSMGSTSTLTLASNATVNGGAAANDDLILQGTSNATRTSSYVILQPNGGNVGIGTSTPGQELSVNGDIQISSATGKLYDTYVTAGISLGATNETALSGFGASSIVGALNELKNVDKNSSHNDYVSWASHYQSRAEGSPLTDSEALNGLFFDTFADSTKLDGVNTTTSLNTQISDNRSQVGLTGGQTYNSSTADNDGQTYLGSNAVNDTFYYDRTRDSSPEVLVELGIDPNWYNGVTLSVATSSATYSPAGTLSEKNPNLTTSYNGSLIKATGTDSTPRTIFITIKTPTTFDWTNYQGDAATGVTITPGSAQTLGSTGVSVTFSAVNYNVGDVFRIASWYIEAEGANRGAKQEFPERSYLVATTSSVDIIDADTQKLWMGFDQGTGYMLGVDTNNDPTAASALNGSLYIAQNGSAATGLYTLNFVADSASKRDATDLRRSDISLAGRNTAISYNVSNTTNTLVAAAANDVAAAVIPNHPTQEITVSGWGYMLGTDVNGGSETVSLPYTFVDDPVVITSSIGVTPATTIIKNFTDCDDTGAGTSINTTASAITNNSFLFGMRHTDGSNTPSSYYYCYAWTATGTVSPKQFVAVASGASSSDGGTTIINVTDGSKADLDLGSQSASVVWSDNIALAGNTAYFSQYYEASPDEKVEVYRGVHGLISETTFAQYRTGQYRVGNQAASWSAYGPTILGPFPSYNNIKSLHVTEDTSTIDPNSNTIYVGTTLGLSVINEKEGNANTLDGYFESQGSVKYYTADYISEEMIGDIRGMWPLNNSNTASDFEDVSIKANTLTGTNITASGDSASGVRGTATDFDGSTEYMSCTDASCGGTSKLDMGSNSWSTGAWIKTTQSSTGMILSKGTTASYSYDLAINYTAGKATYRLYQAAGSSYLTVDSSASINDGKWHHIVGVFDSKELKVQIFVDGVLSGTSTTTAGTLNTDSSADFNLGRRADGNFLFNGYLDEAFATATALTPAQIKHMYQVGYRALQSHSASLGGGAADSNQELAGSTNTIGAAQPNLNNQFLYVGTNNTTSGALSKIQLNSDTLIKAYTASANTPSGGTTLIDEDVTSLAVGYQLEAVGSAASGVKSMAPDNNANGTSGTTYSKPQTLSSSTKFAFLWLSGVTDSSDGSSALTPYACNAYATAALCTSNAAWVAGTLIQTDTNLTPPEREYSFAFPTSGSNLIFRFDLARGSTKTNTYLTRYGASWGSSVGGADIAERYQSSEPAYPGDIVSIASPVKDGVATVALSRTAYDQKAIGVVTTNPGIVMDENLVDLNWNAASRNSPDRPAVALAGRVPVKVTSLGGPIQVGDPITTSTVAGYGQKALGAGQIIGKALESFDCSSPSANPLEENASHCTGKVMIFVNISHFEPTLYLTDLGDFIYRGTLEDNPSASSSSSPIIKLVRVLADGSQEVIDRIGTFGSLVTGSLKSQSIATDFISPIASGSAITMTAPVKIAPREDLGMPALVVEGELDAATISARTAYIESAEVKTLVADKIIANSIEGLDAKIASLSAGTSSALSEDDLTRLTGEIRSRLTNLVKSGSTATDLPVPEEGDPTLLASPVFTLPDLASDSAIVSALSVNTLIAADLTVSNTLYVTSLNSHTGLLALGQNTLTIDQTGLVTVNGDLTVNGNLIAQTGTFDNLTLGDTATPSALGELLSVYNEEGIQVASLDASGSASFADLSTQLVTIAASSATSSALVSDASTNATAGTSILPQGDTSTTIVNPFVTPESLIYLTPTANTEGKVLFVSAKHSCTIEGDEQESCQAYFTVSVDSPATSDISFNWWIIRLAQ